MLLRDAEEDVLCVLELFPAVYCFPGGHSYSPGHIPGRQVVVLDDAVQRRGRKNIEAIVPAGPGRLGGIALVPVAALKQIADLQKGQLVQGLGDQAALADDFPGFQKLRRP